MRSDVIVISGEGGNMEAAPDQADSYPPSRPS